MCFSGWQREKRGRVTRLRKGGLGHLAIVRGILAGDDGSSRPLVVLGIVGCSNVTTRELVQLVQRTALFGKS